MDAEMVLFGIILLAGFYMAWSIGANDVSNAMGTAVGSGALTLKRAVILAAIFEFSGAFLAGSYVSETVQKGIIDPQMFTHTPMIWVFGMIATLLAAGGWLQLACYFGWPVSTTHSIVGALVGFGWMVGGVEAVQWGALGSIVLSWILSPLLGGTIAFILFSLLRRNIFAVREPLRAMKRVVPLLLFVVSTILGSVFLASRLKERFDLGYGTLFILAISLGGLVYIIARLLLGRLPDSISRPLEEAGENPAVAIGMEKTLKHLRRAHANASEEMRPQVTKMIKEARVLAINCRMRSHPEGRSPDFQKVEKTFAYLQWISACALAFSHGANDVANAIGPLAGGLEVLRTQSMDFVSEIPKKILLLGGIGIVVGLATWGWRVIETIGKKITELTPSRGFSAEIAAALTISLASRMGLPVSTTHTLVGAVLGVGLARGLQSVNLNTVRDIFISWIITIPAGAGLAILFYYLLKVCFPL